MPRRTFLALGVGAAVGLGVSGDAIRPGPWSDPARYGQELQHFDIGVEPIDTEFDLVHGMNWSNTPGVTELADGLLVERLEENLINKRSPFKEYVPNPPINACGGYLRTNGAFMMTCEMESVTPLHVQFYGDLPYLLDDDRYENGRVDCEVGLDTLTVSVWRGGGHLPRTAEFPLNLHGYSREIRMQADDEDLLFFDRGGLVGRMSGKDVFRDGTVWCGLNNYEGQSIVRSLRFSEMGVDQLSGHWNPYSVRVPHSNEPVMQNLVDKYGLSLNMGSSVSLFPAMQSLEYLQHYFDGKYKILTIENAMKQLYLEPMPGVFEPKHALSLIDLIRRHDMLVHGHVALYDKAMRKDISDMPYDTLAEKMRVAAYIEDYIQKFGETFGKYLYSCDITNEVWDGFGPTWLPGILGVGGHMRPNIFYRALGKEYLRIAYRAAAAAMPDTLLTLNEFGLERDTRWRAKHVFGLVDYVRGGGGRVDMVGSQTHISSPSSVVGARDYQKVLALARQHNVGLRISELDVTPLIGTVAQSEQFCLPVEAGLTDDNVDSVVLWGSNDGNASQAGRNLVTGEYVPGGATPIDEYWHYKYAWQAIQNTIHRVGSVR